MNKPCVMFVKAVRLPAATGAMSVNQLSFLPTVNGIFRKSNILENIHSHKIYEQFKLRTYATKHFPH